MFFRLDLMEITLKLTLIPLKITKVVNFHSQNVLLIHFLLIVIHFSKLKKIDFW
jgi:hypothetical protein